MQKEQSQQTSTHQDIFQKSQSSVSHGTTNSQETYENCFLDFCRIYDNQQANDGNLMHACILALGASIQKSEALTFQGILTELSHTIEYFNRQSILPENKYRFKSRLTFKALSAIFLKMIRKELSREKDYKTDIQQFKKNVEIQTALLAKHSIQSVELIQKNSQNMLRDGMKILVHSYSRAVIGVLKFASERGIRISVIVTESQPILNGKLVQEFCESCQIPCITVLDSSIGLCMNQIDCVFVGAEAVLENGGIVNRVGTFTIAICAKVYNKPFYVFAESLKFMKRFPLQQSDIFEMLDEDSLSTNLHHTDKNQQNNLIEKTDLSNILVDYTPPEYISELFTDIGIFTPAAVSDELIKFFQD